MGWVEFKEPTMVGTDINALANSATLHERDYEYTIWALLIYVI